MVNTDVRLDETDQHDDARPHSVAALVDLGILTISAPDRLTRPQGAGENRYTRTRSYCGRSGQPGAWVHIVERAAPTRLAAWSCCAPRRPGSRHSSRRLRRWRGG